MSTICLGVNVMNEIIRRLKVLVRHLELIDEFFYKNDDVYKEFSDKVKSLAHYEDLLNSIYVGKNGRQMMLADLLCYLILSRGITWIWTKNKSDCIKLLLYIGNMVLAQEHLTQAMYLNLRREFMEYLENVMDKEGFTNIFLQMMNQEMCMKKPRT